MHIFREWSSTPDELMNHSSFQKGSFDIDIRQISFKRFTDEAFSFFFYDFVFIFGRNVIKYAFHVRILCLERERRNEKLSRGMEPELLVLS